MCLARHRAHYTSKAPHALCLTSTLQVCPLSPLALTNLLQSCHQESGEHELERLQLREQAVTIAKRELSARERELAVREREFERRVLGAWLHEECTTIMWPLLVSQAMRILDTNNCTALLLRLVLI